ncbi:MAG: bifunctional phosphopantothenoylcysteine decarboxylase/phosphopantothenate--cysteine ligase CoaBC [Lachnospiraceae bacterium]|nr:bifunctional phosphopantothenoylcysteine decarboxylase/phosphopantothenate--cysteine ligase CoaBC [Lachnospiraceae bacterium]
MLKGKNILLAVTGGIAAYKMADVASMLVKQGADVHVVMTKNATNFIPAETFQVLTKNKVYTDCFDEDPDDYVNVPHISLGTSADCILVAPATADVIGKIANGIADDMVTTTILPALCPVLIAPSMNGYMFDNPIVQDNISKLKKFGYKIIEPSFGHLACGYDGKGKLPSPEDLVENVLLAVARDKDLKGKKVLVNAGPTEESIDPIRVITNHSSGKMGYAIARQAAFRGAGVTLVSGPTNLKSPMGVEVISIKSAEDMYQEMVKNADQADIIIMAAAVADYTPVTTAENKIKKTEGDFSIPLKRTKDILLSIGQQKKDGQFICGFSMETENMLENSRKKLIKKNADMICANNLRQAGAGYQVDTNILTLIQKDFEKELPLLSKDEAANEILTVIKNSLKK